MRPKKHETTGEQDLFRARLDQIGSIGDQAAGGDKTPFDIDGRQFVVACEQRLSG